MGSRLSTHAFWTLTLSAAISLLALSPIVLPSSTPLERLPGPLAGAQRVSRVIVTALAPSREESEARAVPRRASTPAPSTSEPDAGSGVLGARAEEPPEATRPPKKPPKHVTGTGGAPAPPPVVPVPDDPGEDAEKGDCKKKEKKDKDDEHQGEHEDEDDGDDDEDEDDGKDKKEKGGKKQQKHDHEDDEDDDDGGDGDHDDDDD